MLAPTRAADDADKEVRAVVEKAIKAHGGADKLAKFKGAVVKGKGSADIGGMNVEYTSTTTLQLPDRMRLDVDLDVNGMKITFTQVLNGHKGWIKLLDKTKEMEKDHVAEAREQAHAAWVATLAPLTDKEFKLGSLGESKIDGKEAIGVQVARKDRRDVNLFFDKKSGMLLKSEFRTKDLLGDGKEFTAETFYSDYKEIDGAQHAMKQTQKRDGKDFGKNEISEIEKKDKFEDSVFAKP